MCSTKDGENINVEAVEDAIAMLKIGNKHIEVEEVKGVIAKLKKGTSAEHGRITGKLLKNMRKKGDRQ